MDGLSQSLSRKVDSLTALVRSVSFNAAARRRNAGLNRSSHANKALLVLKAEFGEHAGMAPAVLGTLGQGPRLYPATYIQLLRLNDAQLAALGAFYDEEFAGHNLQQRQLAFAEFIGAY